MGDAATASGPEESTHVERSDPGMSLLLLSSTIPSLASKMELKKLHARLAGGTCTAQSQHAFDAGTALTRQLLMVMLLSCCASPLLFADKSSISTPSAQSRKPDHDGVHLVEMCDRQSWRRLFRNRQKSFFEHESRASTGADW